MRFDATITLGSIVQIATVLIAAVVFFNALSARLSVFENRLNDHASDLQKHERQIYSLLSSLQRLIGRSEVALRNSTRPTAFETPGNPEPDEDG